MYMYTQWAVHLCAADEQNYFGSARVELSTPLTPPRVLELSPLAPLPPLSPLSPREIEPSSR